MEQDREKFFKKINQLLDEFFPEKFDFQSIEKYQFFKWEKKVFTYYLKHILNPQIIDFEDLIGIDAIKEQVYNNTLQFVKGYPANNVLLWGERGCGKSSLIKSIVKKFSNSNLKLIEVRRRDFQSLEELFDLVVKINYKFIIFLDDISFSTEDVEYKALKSILDGSVISSHENILIYATSNRRHMVKEHHISEDEIHKIDVISERVSLSDRFGISLGIYKPNKDVYLKIVKNYIRKFSVENFYTEQDALNFAMYKGGFSGRTAYQFAINLIGKRLENGNSTF